MTYKLAVILPSPYSGGVVRSLINICRMLVIGARRCGDDLRLTVGLPKDQGWSPQNAEVFAGLDIQTRVFEAKYIRRGNLLSNIGSFGATQSPPKVICFSDGISNFEDSDFWFLISDAVKGALPAHRKYACMVYDYANRYVPEIFHEGQWRDFHYRTEATVGAAFVVTTTEQARRDVINFAGADPNRVHVFPIEFDPINMAEVDSDPGDGNQFEPLSFVLWPTIISGHENHMSILRGLESFLATSKLRVVVIGKGTSSFNPENSSPAIQHPYVEDIRNLIRSSHLLKNRLVFLDFVSDNLLLSLMRRATCILHTSRGDNGTYTVVEGAWQGTPALSNRYPAMEYVGEYFGLPMEFFDYYRPGSLVEGLERVHRERQALCERLPSREVLKRYSYDNLAECYWKQFSANMRAALEAQV